MYERENLLFIELYRICYVSDEVLIGVECFNSLAFEFLLLFVTQAEISKVLHMSTDEFVNLSFRIIALNSEAKALGVKRYTMGQDARRICPSLHLFKVQERRGKADLTK